jgi:hypothetical protein
MSTEARTFQLFEAAEIIRNEDSSWTVYLGMDCYTGTYFSCALWLYTHSIGG